MVRITTHHLPSFHTLFLCTWFPYTFAARSFIPFIPVSFFVGSVVGSRPRRFPSFVCPLSFVASGPLFGFFFSLVISGVFFVFVFFPSGVAWWPLLCRFLFPFLSLRGWLVACLGGCVVFSPLFVVRCSLFASSLACCIRFVSYLTTLTTLTTFVFARPAVLRSGVPSSFFSFFFFSLPLLFFSSFRSLRSLVYRPFAKSPLFFVHPSVPVPYFSLSFFILRTLLSPDRPIVVPCCFPKSTRHQLTNPTNHHHNQTSVPSNPTETSLTRLETVDLLSSPVSLLKKRGFSQPGVFPFFCFWPSHGCPGFGLGFSL
jgi:hypothetical protein